MVKLTEEDEGHAFSNHSFTIKGNNNVTTGMDCVLFILFSETQPSSYQSRLTWNDPIDELEERKELGRTLPMALALL